MNASTDPPGHDRRPYRYWLLRLTVLLLLILISFGFYHVYKPLPPGLDFAGPERPAPEVRFWADRTYTDTDGERHTEQTIFDRVFGLIDGARRFVLVDMFLFNDFQGELSETHRPLSSELTERLIRQKRRHPDMQVLVITDPLNTVYGGLRSPHLERLEEAGISVTLTDLSRMRDSNPLHSSLWRLLVRPWGNSPGGGLPNPFGEGGVSLRSYLALLNFKANHRKLIIADRDGELAALVSSANPHDGSSAHGNVALEFTGPAARDLLDSEVAVLAFSGGPEPAPGIPPADSEAPGDGASLQVVTERSVERAALSLIEGARPGERLDLAMFYLSDRDLVQALTEAAGRGVRLRVLLDPNKDAFGREKNGVPNRPVAHELVRAGAGLRWCDTRGEQCHSKWLMHRSETGRASLLLGSTNFTRRNFHNLNLETSVILRGPREIEPLARAADWFDERWHNRRGRRYSLPYPAYADERLRARFLYRTMEASGVSTF